MKKINRRNFLKIAGATSSVAMLAACGGENTSTAASSSADATTTGGDEATGEFFPLAESVKVSIAHRGNTAFLPHDDMELFKVVNEMTNVEVDWIDWVGESGNEKRNLAFASNDLPDAMFGSWVVETRDVVTYGDEGFLVDFLPYIESGAMPNLAAAIEKRPTIKTANITPSGQLFLLPNINTTEPVPITSEAMYINETWLEKVGKEMPTTTEEFYEVLKAFKAMPELAGSNDMIPLSFRFGDGNAGETMIAGWFGLSYDGNNNPNVRDDGTVVWTAAEPEYKDFLNYMHRLYSEDLVDKEIFTMMDSAPYLAKINNPEPFVGAHCQWSAYDTNNEITTGDVYVPLAPLKSDNGNDPVVQMRVRADNGTPGFAISSKSEHIDLLIKWIDLFYDVDMSRMSLYGGDKYLEEVSDGVFKVIPMADGTTPDWTDRSDVCPGNFSVWCVLAEDFQWENYSDSLEVKLSLDDVYAPYVPTNVFPSSAFTTAEEAEVLARYRTDIVEYMEATSANFITNGFTDADWDEYVQGLYDLRLQDMIDVWQAVYDRAGSFA